MYFTYMLILTYFLLTNKRKKVSLIVFNRKKKKRKVEQQIATQRCTKRITWRIHDATIVKMIMMLKNWAAPHFPGCHRSTIYLFFLNSFFSFFSNFYYPSDHFHHPFITQVQEINPKDILLLLLLISCSIFVCSVVKVVTKTPTKRISTYISPYLLCTQIFL